MCSDVQEEDGVVGKEIWICHTETGKMCFPEHTTDNHLQSFTAWLNIMETIVFFALTSCHHHGDSFIMG